MSLCRAGHLYQRHDAVASDWSKVYSHDRARTGRRVGSILYEPLNIVFCRLAHRQQFFWHYELFRLAQLFCHVSTVCKFNLFNASFRSCFPSRC